jgi:hypothetical protein
VADGADYISSFARVKYFSPPIFFRTRLLARGLARRLRRGGIAMVCAGMNVDGGRRASSVPRVTA